MLRQLTR